MTIYLYLYPGQSSYLTSCASEDALPSPTTAAGPPDLAKLWGVDGVAGKELGQVGSYTENDLANSKPCKPYAPAPSLRKGTGDDDVVTLSSEECETLGALGKVKGGVEVGQGEVRRG